MEDPYRTAAEGLADWFREEPLSITMESDMQAWLIIQLNEQLAKTHAIINPDVSGFSGDKPLTRIDSAPNYKEPYVHEILNRQLCSAKPSDQQQANKAVSVPRAQTEVNVTKEEAQNKQLDVGVLKKQLSNPVKWNDGSKRYAPEDLEAAFELKFIANQNIISNPWGRSGLNEMSGEQIRKQDHEAVADADEDLQPDINSLRGLPTEDVYFVIVSQYNYLMQEPLLEESDNRHRQRNEKLGPLVNQWMQAETSKNGAPDVFYVHPGGAVVWRNGQQEEMPVKG